MLFFKIMYLLINLLKTFNDKHLNHTKCKNFKVISSTKLDEHYYQYCSLFLNLARLLKPAR